MGSPEFICKGVNLAGILVDGRLMMSSKTGEIARLTRISWSRDAAHAWLTSSKILNL